MQPSCWQWRAGAESKIASTSLLPVVLLESHVEEGRVTSQGTYLEDVLSPLAGLSQVPPSSARFPRGSGTHVLQHQLLVSPTTNTSCVCCLSVSVMGSSRRLIAGWPLAQTLRVGGCNSPTLSDVEVRELLTLANGIANFQGQPLL